MIRRKSSFGRGFGKRAIRLTMVLAASLLALLVFGLASVTHAQQRIVIVGTGSTVPAPLYTEWAQAYGKQNPKLQIRYLPVGTEEGLKELSRKSGDFAAGEMPLSEKQRAESGLVEIPVSLVAIVIIYNLPQVHEELRFSGDVLADIYLGTIRNWSAPQIAKLNPGVSLPDLPIKIVQRPAGKGSNYIFSDFLSKTSPKFHSQIGASLSPKWPLGEPAERSSDMANKVKAEPGSIGFVEYQYAAKNHIQHALLMNQVGKFVKASSQTLVAACENNEGSGWHNLSASLIYAHGADSYPMTSFTWLYLPAKTQDPLRAASLESLLEWILSDGQTVAEQEGYTGLPTPLLAEAKKKLSTLH